MLKHQQRHKNLGVTLLELMLVLSVIAAIALAVTRYYATAREEAKITQAVSMVNDVVSASFTWVGGFSNFGGDPQASPPISLNTSTLVKAGLLPAIYLKANANPWQGSIKVAVGKADTNKMEVTLDKVPINSCTALKKKIENVGGDTLGSTCSSGSFSVIFYENPTSP